MSRRNHYYNNSDNFYQYEHYPNYHYGAYQTEPYENDGYTYNYYTNGNNSDAFQNWHSRNQNYGATYDNMQYRNWEYRNFMNHANQWNRRNRISNDKTHIRSNNYSHNSSPNSPSDRKFVNKFSNNNSNQAKQSAGVFPNNNSNQPKRSAGVFSNDNSNQAKQSAVFFSNNNSNQTKQSAGVFSNNNSNQAKQSAGVHDKDSVKNTISPEVDKNLESMERPTTRIISKKSLREGTENQKYEQTEPYNYTDYWLKGREGDVKSPLVEEFEEPEDPCYVLETRQRKKCKNKTSNKKQNQELKATKFEKKARKIFTTPVEMSKGKSLLEKMGWKGGGLGKDGSGIVEPVTPNMSYVGATLGLGQSTEEDDDDLHFTDHTYLRTLKVILEFVKNDLENELKFDTRLSPMERKRIHRTVQEMRDGVEKFPEPYKSVIRDICYHNHYELYTESEGFQKSRHLNLYKEPNEHMYIVIPEDLNDEEENDNVACKKTKNTKSNNGTGAAESNIEIISAENKVKENNVSTQDNSNVVTSQFIEQNVINIEEENNVNLIGNEPKVLENNEAINQEEIFFVKVDNIENEVLDKDCQKNIYTSNEEQIQANLQDACNIKYELSGQENDKVSDQEKNSYTENEVLAKNNRVVTENLQENIHSVPKIESNSNIDKNSTVVKPDKKNLTKKQIAKLSAEKKKKETKINAKHVIHIEKKENNKREDNEILDTIIKYFVEYTQDPLVTEFRFLGPFDYKERRAIDMFFKVCKGIHKIDKSQEVLDLFDCIEFYLELRQDNNGSNVIFKIWKEKDSSVNK